MLCQIFQELSPANIFVQVSAYFPENINFLKEFSAALLSNFYHLFIYFFIITKYFKL